MIWLVLLVLLMTVITLVRLTRHVIEPEAHTSATLRTMLKMYAIQSSLLASRTHREAQRDTEAIRHRLMQELDAMTPGDYGEPEG